MLLYCCDTIVTDLLESWCNRIQRAIGFSCFSVARVLLAVNAVYAIIALVEDTRQAVLIILLFHLYVSYLYGSAVDESVARGECNPFRLYAVGIRVGYLCLMIVQLSTATFNPPTYTLWLCMHLFSCTPLPPAKSKVREWIDSFSSRPVFLPAKS